MKRSTLVHVSCLVLAVSVVACDDTQPPVDTTPGDTTLADTTLDSSAGPDDTASADSTSEPDTTPVEDTAGSDVPEDVTPDAEPDTGATDADVAVDTDAGVDTNEPPKGCGFGSIKGRSCSPNGQWLSGVRVRVESNDCDGQLVVSEDTTSEEGFFELSNVPAGNQTVIIETGSYTTEVKDIEVRDGEVTDLTGQLQKFCLESKSAEIAVLTGVFDHVEALFDGQGVAYELYEGDSADLNPEPQRSGLDLLLDLESLLAYDIVVINSGEWYRLFADGIDVEPVLTMRQNLHTYVQNGGSLFVTDWAYYWMESVFPGAIHFYGDPAPDANGQHSPGEEGPAKIGRLDPNVVAAIQTDGFRAALDGAETMTINFNWAAWIVATGANFQSEVHLLAESAQIYDEPHVLENVPLVVSYKPTATSGTVFFSAFHAAVQPTAQMEAALNYILFQL